MWEVLVFNRMGKLIKTIKLNEENGEIDFSDLKSGSYFVKVKFIDGSSYYDKLILD